MAPPLPVNFTEQEKEEIKQSFNQFDEDKNGHIDAKEVRNVLIAIGEKDVPGYRVRELIEEVDLNKNGTIEFDEFLYVCSSFFFLSLFFLSLSFLISSPPTVPQFVAHLYLACRNVGNKIPVHVLDTIECARRKRWSWINR